ncbi:NnrS family protein [Arcobacter arenosus]|uniref:NnrS family protein n=1 Tax=Arcobacter arenosus TaxID=2576037 RepID=A0A5R8Y437_9BACT|nr:NnrS family protein [Arcobacter arenosus]TLP40869.1 NnrS family protein [Arcobacter arenosus]
MQFSTNQNGFTPKIEEKWWDRFTSQSHQLYFTSSIFFAIVVMILTFVSFLGKLHLDFSLIHGFGLNYAVFTNAFLGFLITVIPKFNGAKVIPKEKYLKPWFIFQGGIVLSFLDAIFLGKLLVSFVMLYFVKIFYETIKEGKASYKKDSIFLNLVFFMGALFLLFEVLFQTNVSLLIFFGYLISLVFLVAQRMIPAFYGSYMKVMAWEKPKYIREISVMLFLGLGIALEFELFLLLKLISFVAMLFFGYIVMNLNIYKKTPAIIFILVISFIWLEVGFIALFLESIYEVYSLKLALHIFALGFVATLLIGFGSRVVMGHAVPAQQIVADKITKFIFVLTQVLVVSRICASILFLNDSTVYMGILHLSSWLWIVMFLIWTIRYAKTLTRIKS